MDTYYVTRIEEPDFGCEGRPEGQEIKDKVYLEEEIDSKRIQNQYQDLTLVLKEKELSLKLLYIRILLLIVRLFKVLLIHHQK